MADDRPVFAFTLHRSGSTLLGRILNCHPNLVVWGEHSGFVNQLAEIDFLAKNNQILRASQTGDDAWLKRFTSDASFRSSSLQPWTMPPYFKEGRKYHKEMIQRLFTQHLRPGQRWGFKDIRYHRPYVARYLLEMFPNGKLVLLSRDVADAAVSNILSEWSQEWIKEFVKDETQELADEIIRDVVYALLAYMAGLKDIKKNHPKKSFEVNYNSLRDRDVPYAKQMLEFLGLHVTKEVESNIIAAFGKKFNKTRKVPLQSDILTANYIRQKANQLAPGLQAEIDANKVDPARLVSTTAPGRFSFLTGSMRTEYMRF